MESHRENKVQGAESILLHNGNIVLGMQKPDRWYIQDNGTKASIIKTIGGKIEVEDNDNSRNAVKREILEEIKGVEDIRLSKEPIFSKQVLLGELNPYEKSSNISLNADFYVAEIEKEGNLEPNDLPALIEIPIEQFLKMNFGRSDFLRCIQKYVTKNLTLYKDLELPENYAIMVPQEVKDFLKYYKSQMGDSI